MEDCNNHQNNFQWHRDELKVTGSDVGVEKKKIGDTFLNSSENKGSSREMNRILLVWKGRNQIFHLHFSQYCLEHLHLQKHSTFLQLVEPNGVEANLEVAFALLSALGTCFKTDIWVWSWTVMLLPWQSKRNKIRHTLCCEVGCAATEHIYCVSELSPGTRTAKHHLTLNSLYNITTRIPFIIPVSFTLQGKGEQKEEYFSSPSKYPILSFQQ